MNVFTMCARCVRGNARNVVRKQFPFHQLLCLKDENIGLLHPRNIISKKKISAIQPGAEKS